ncbi:Hypothetical protein ABZS17G119_00094 [Kosakonia cowanii]
MCWGFYVFSTAIAITFAEIGQIHLLSRYLYQSYQFFFIFI